MSELAYSLESTACPDGGQFTLELLLLTAAGVLQAAPPQTGETVRKWIVEKDRPLVPWLTANLKRPATTISVETAQLQTTLRLLAATGKLFFCGQRLFCDFFSRSTFQYGIRRVENLWYVTGYVVEGARRWPLTSCEALRLGCYVRGGQLRFFANSTPWRHLSPLYQHSPLLLEGVWREQLEAIWRESPDLLVFEEGCSAADLWGPGDPLPILAMTDRAGAFANLLVDYGEGRQFHYNRSATKQEEKQRNLAAEKVLEADLLTSEFIWKPSGTSAYYCPVDKVTKALTFMLEVGWKVIDWQGNILSLCSHTTLAVREDEQQIVVSGTFRYGEASVSLSALIGSWKRHDRFIQVGVGHVGLIPEGPLVSDLAIAAMEGEIVGDRLVLPVMKKGLLDSLSDKVPVWERPHQPSTSDLEMKAFVGNLRPYQRIGVEWLVNLCRSHLHGLLADDMGLGKTVQVLAFLATLEATVPHLIVVPTSLLYNWKSEAARFLPSYTVFIHHGPERPATAAGWGETDIVITSYALLRLDSALFQSTAFHCLILDEGHTIKNSASQTAIAACAVKAIFRLSMTGTPLENNLQELWSQFHFLLPGLLRQRELLDNAGNATFLLRTKRQIAPFLLRRTKEQVAPELPPKIEQTVWVTMEPGQRHYYDSFLAGVKSNLLQKVRLDGAGRHHLAILEVILRLRQICCHPSLAGSDGAIASAKFDAAIADLETLAAEGAKVLVYSQFTTLLKLVGKALDERDFSYCYLDGQTRERAAVVSAFQEDPSIPFFLISLKAGGVGLNLTAADYVLLLDPWWNDAAEQQAIDRAHRIGRIAPVIAKRYITLGTIEEKILQLKEQKKALACSLFGDAVGAGEMPTSEELAWLLDSV